MTVYEVVRDSPQALLNDLRKHENTAVYFYGMRNLDRDESGYQALSKVELASRFLYLNHTCFNGLHRVNKSGQFNVPYGDYRAPRIVQESSIYAMSQYLNANQITIVNQDFAGVLDRLEKGSFVYLDPPYDPIPGRGNFTAYTRNGFDRYDQERLKVCCDSLTRRGVRFLLSNADTDAIRDLYQGYSICTVKGHRSVNVDSDKRIPADEVLIGNYEKQKQVRPSHFALSIKYCRKKEGQHSIKKERPRHSSKEWRGILLCSMLCLKIPNSLHHIVQ